jgi:SAM-dependent methyltransferase
MANTELWKRQQIGYKENSHKRHFPTEYVLRSLFSKSYFNNFKEVVEGNNVLDIGCLYGNNLVPFSDRGCNLYGMEVTKDAVEISREATKSQGLNATILQGVNTNLPFENDNFDFVLSINTIHYEQSKENVKNALKEFKRVLKKDGCLFISSAGQNHYFVNSAIKNWPNNYTVTLNDDFRCGETFSFFDSLDDFREILLDDFSTVETAVVKEAYPTRDLEFYLGKCLI